MPNLRRRGDPPPAKRGDPLRVLVKDGTPSCVSSRPRHCMGATRWPLLLVWVREEERRMAAESEKVRNKMTAMKDKRLPVKTKGSSCHDARHPIFDTDSDDSVDEGVQGPVPIPKNPAARRGIAGRGVGR